MLTITIRDKEFANRQASPYLVLVARDSTAYTAYKTIAEFMEEWRDSLDNMKLSTPIFTSQPSLVLMSDYTVNDKSIYYDAMELAWKNGARKCNLMSNGSIVPGAILVDKANMQTTFFRLNPNDAKHDELTGAKKSIDLERVKSEAYISSQIIEAFEHVTSSEISFNDLQDIAGGIAHKITLKIEGKL